MYAGGIKVRVRSKKAGFPSFYDLFPCMYSTLCKTITIPKSALHCDESLPIEFLSLTSVTPATFLSSKLTSIKPPEIASG